MYDINLIRASVVPDQRKNVMFSVISASALVYVLTILAVVFFSAANFRMIDVYAHEIDRMQDDVSAIYPGSPSHDDLNVIVRRIKPDLKEIGSLIDGRTEFTYLWEAVACCVPDGAWLTRIELKVPAARDDRKGRSASGLFIEGLALTDGETEGDEVIRDFALALEDNAELSVYITEAKFAETGRKKLGGEDVIGFEITCPFR
jgi:hypothetical protein